MNILFLDQFSESGGAQFCLKDLMPEVLRRGWNPRLMVPGSGELVQWCSQVGIPTHALPLRPYSNARKSALDFLRFSIDAPRMAAAVRHVVQRESVDLVYVNGPRVLPAALGVSCPVVFHAHSHIPVKYGQKLIDWTLHNTGATVIAASEYVAEDYRQTLGHRKVRVTYNGIRDLGRGTRDFHRRPVRVGIIGRIAFEKGQLDFVRAARQLLEDDAEAEFFIYGERLFSGAAYEAQVRAAAGNTRIKFCGWADDVAQPLHDLEILAVPSGQSDAAPRVVMEALSAGTPVVAYRSGGIPELVDHGRTGLLTETRDFSALARSIRMLMENPELMEELSAAERSEWQRRFRVERYRADVCDLIESWAPPCPNGAAPLVRLSSI